MKKYNAIIILGATATGKTAISIELAKVLNTEIINADSTQVYKQLNIGTAKATKEEMQGIKHHLIDFLNPDQEFSVSIFREKAVPIIENLQKQNKVPIIVGGTGFYIESLFNNYNYSNAVKNDDIRKKYEQYYNDYGKTALHNLLKAKDPVAAKKIHENDVSRVIRAIEIFEITGKTKTEHILMQGNEQIVESPVKPLIIGLNLPREVMYDRINRRTDQMLENGLIDEARVLFKAGYSENLQSIKSIGYKELYAYFNKQCTLDEATEKIKQNTRNYAKRQVTWFKRNPGIVWVDVSLSSVSNIVQDIINLFNE